MNDYGAAFFHEVVKIWQRAGLELYKPTIYKVPFGELQHKPGFMTAINLK
jgi:hypothetical protein